MKTLKALACLLSVSALAPAETRDYPVKPVPFTAVHIHDIFWAPRIETNRAVTIPFAFEQDQKSGRFYNFERAAQALKGTPPSDLRPPGYPFDDTDVYKVLEGASYTLSVHPDPKLDAYLDEVIAKIAAAQEPDGYLYTTRTINPLSPHPWSGKERWILEGVNSHELYDLGHLYEAAVAHYQATGKRTLLDVALRTANLLDATFGPDKRSIWPGHQIVEMGLAKLYRVTGEERYLNLAKFMLDQRGPQSKEQGAGNPYVQAHMRVVDQTEAVAGGHAVRATYMYSGMADVAALTGDMAYVHAIDKIWDDVAEHKISVTGGIGPRAAGEAFGAAYELPNLTAYNETCAAVGNDFWNHRLFLLHADSKYIDIMERTLYNGLISGVSLDGKSFFYENPLEATGYAGKDSRQPWFGVACCPGNITRFMASVPGYVYAQRNDTLWVNLFAASTADVKLDNGHTVKVTQETHYPWDGAVKMTVEPDQAGPLTINVRIPGWARNEPVPSDLYRFADKSTRQVTLKVNGQNVPLKLDKGYVALTRTWKKGDTIDLNMPMTVRRVLANEKVEADRGRVAIQRGPIVYAAEWADNPDHKVRNLMLPDSEPLTAVWNAEMLKGVMVVRGKAVAFSRDDKGVHKNTVGMTMIPYSTWANRGKGQMVVWLATSEAGVVPAAPPTTSSIAKVTSSGTKDPRAIQDEEDKPASSHQGGIYFDWWPQGTGNGANSKVTNGWIEYTFETPTRVSQSQIYWFDDAPRGGVRVPGSWRILYKDGSEWKPVENSGAWGVEKDKYNVVTVKPVATTALRLEVDFQKSFSAGVQRWKVK